MVTMAKKVIVIKGEDGEDQTLMEILNEVPKARRVALTFSGVEAEVDKLLQKVRRPPVGWVCTGRLREPGGRTTCFCKLILLYISVPAL